MNTERSRPKISNAQRRVLEALAREGATIEDDGDYVDIRGAGVHHFTRPMLERLLKNDWVALVCERRKVIRYGFYRTYAITDLGLAALKDPRL